MNGDALLLSLRQCATHSAGPLRAVADLAVAVPDLGLVGVAEIIDDVTARLEVTEMLPERRAAIVAFLAVVWQGLLALAVEADVDG